MSKQQLKDYLVVVTRTSWDSAEFKVRARNKTEAEDKAREEALDHVFDRNGNADYEIESCEVCKDI